MKKQLGQLLLEKNVISDEQLQEVLKLQKEKGGLLGQILIEQKMISEEDLVMALADQYGFPYLPLANYDVNQDALKMVPEAVARQYFLIPIDKIANVLTVVMADPLNDYAIKDIEYITKCKVTTFVSTATDIRNAIDKHYGTQEKDKIETQRQAANANFSNAPRKAEEDNTQAQ